MQRRLCSDPLKQITYISVYNKDLMKDECRSNCSQNNVFWNLKFTTEMNLL